MKNQHNQWQGWLVAAAVIGLSAPAWASVFYQEGFETSTIGASPAGWNVLDANAGYVNITGSQTASANIWVQAAPSPQPFNGAKALNYVGNSGTVQPFGWITSIPASYPSYDVTFSFDFNLQPSAATQPTSVSLTAANQSGIYVWFDTAGTGVRLYEPWTYGLSSTVAISPSTWYHAKLALAPTGSGTSQATLTITDASDTPVGSPINWYYSGPQMNTGFTYIRMQEDALASGVSNFYDNFLLDQANPEPTVGALLVCGGLLVWRRRNQRND